MAGLGVGSPPGRAGRGSRGGRAAARAGPSAPGAPRSAGRAPASLTSTRARRPPSHGCPALWAVPPAAPRPQPLGACGRGPGVRRGPRRGPAPRPGRMRPGAARELSRAPAPTLRGPGLRSRRRRPAPDRHDFQAAFRLDSLQVRGRRAPLFFNSGARPITLHP